jgi:hypothetical protein
MRSHQLELRLSTNHIESIVECFAKSADAEVKQYLPESSLAITNLENASQSSRSNGGCSRIGMNTITTLGILPKPMPATPGNHDGKSRCGNRPLHAPRLAKIGTSRTNVPQIVQFRFRSEIH